ncbi:uncharacterized protein LOC134829879 [Culicoides brevitarsis]|uniref:uncharacterized protein LOC134829879 n=1 Tax=Culicoides brevitarsis TaxID=469753 RepID=UPI00307BCADC
MEQNLKKIIFILIWMSHVTFSASNNEQKFCPKHCQCDIFADLRRAVCSDQNLINTFAGVPREVEILDLSRNKISLITDHSFEEFTNMVELDLSFNIISTVSFRAFELMDRLEKLDLSYNRIEQLDNRLLESNSNLKELILNGNKFMSLPDQALIKSSSLRKLSMVDSKLVHVPHLMFHALPNVEFLDLSQNLLKNIHIKSFQRMKKLIEVNLEDNPWNCDEEIFKVLKWFQKRGVKIKRNQCYKPKNGHAVFDKIIHATTQAPREEIPLDIVWNITKSVFFPSSTEPTTPANPYKVLSSKCSGDAEIDEIDSDCSFDVCRANLSDLYENFLILTTNYENCQQNHLEAVIAMCYVGLFFGALGGGLLVYLACFLRHRNIKASFTEPLERQRLRKAYQNRSQYAHAQTTRRPMSPENVPQTSTESEIPRRIASPISPSRVPSFRNSSSSEESAIPKSLTPLRSSLPEPEHLYQRRHQPRIPQEQELPAFFKYFRRNQRPQRLSIDVNSRRRSQNSNNEDAYFLPSPETVPSAPRISRLHSVPTDAPESPSRPLMTNAVSSGSVIYNEIDEVSEIPQDVCCTRHIRQELDALTVDLLRDSARVSVTPPPPYIDCMSAHRLNNDTQNPLHQTN